jgi:hypothetical protein
MRPVAPSNPDLVPIEDLDRSILTLCTRINAATYELLVLIREFEERGGYLKWGLDNCAEWLAWRCDISMTTALEKVRVARSLKTLPGISRAFSAGELSYSKVRALTRVANETNEQALVEFALRHTATQVAERCRELRMGEPASRDMAGRAYGNRSLRMRKDSNRGMVNISIELPIDTSELLEKALDKAQDNACLDTPDLVDTSWSVRQADAFVNLLRDFLAGNGDGTSKCDNYLVTIHVDQSALVGAGGRSSLPIDSVKRLCCDSQAVVLTEDAGQPLSIGRKSRIVPAGIERAVRARDKGTCTYPGCNNRRFLHCHHVEHWSNGGETSLANLVLLCTKHHTLVHEGGFRMDKDFAGRWVFFRPDGISVPAAGYHSRDWLDRETGEISTTYDNPPAGGLSSIIERVVGEPPPPVYH